jgi:phenylacetic acid degradation protein
MTIYEFEAKQPVIGRSSYIHEKATVIGNVMIGNDCFIGAGAVIRGDYGTIEIGSRTSVQENSVIHARPEEKSSIGNDVQVGHGAILHNCKIKDLAVIGLGSRICDYAIVGTWAIIGEGSVVSARTEIPDGKVAIGIPAKVVRDVKDEEKKLWGAYKQKYVELASKYKSSLKRIG